LWGVPIAEVSVLCLRAYSLGFAKMYGASVAVEKLNVRGKKGELNKRANSKISRIPHSQFESFPASDCEAIGIPLDRADAYHTSKWCPSCGVINAGHSSPNYALYKCKKCGMVVNSDRKASKAIAVKSALERELSQGLTNLFTRFSSAGVAVNQLFRPDDGVLSGAVHLTRSPMESSFQLGGVVYSEI
jgi:predicted RNA-binding Zn-ribbon protein involved in translation (DUF1610 family)